MAKESFIRKKAVEILEKEGFIYWFPAKVKFKQNDIFGVFDLVCWRKKTNNIKFLQLTTISNFSTRKRKIKDFLKKNRIPDKDLINIEVWGWAENHKKFKIETV